MATDKIDRTDITKVGSYQSSIERDRESERPPSRQRRYRDVAFIASGKGKHRVAAHERAVWMTEKSGIDLTPLDVATKKVWRGRYDLVIAGSEEPWTVKDLIRGNAEKKIVGYCASDVLIVRHRPVAPSRRIVVAVDPDPMARGGTLLAAEAVNAALIFAEWEQSELHPVNVIPQFRYYMLALNAGLMPADARNLEAEARFEQQRNIYQFIDRLDIDRSRMNVHLLQGDPVQTIANVISHLDADLLVIGSAGRRGIGRWLIGHRAEEVMRQVACSSLVVKASRSFRESAP
jgi:universal stress protein E